MNVDRLPNDDEVYERAKVAIQMIEIILADFPLRWQIAILKALGARTTVVSALQQEKPPVVRSV
jgi:hypothetical protein